MFKVDLHSHSSVSDGQLTPTQLVFRACDLGLHMLALTDHDSLHGLDEARAAASGTGLQLVDGVELSCLWGGATVHVLAYDFERNNEKLQRLLNTLSQARQARAEEIGRRLEKVGVADAYAGACKVKQAHSGMADIPARPHFAAYLVEAGYVKDQTEAFRRWLGAGKIGDVKQHWPEMHEVIEPVLAAGGVLSLAHPMQYDFTRSKRRRMVSNFAELGGHAIEISNGMQSATQVNALTALALEFNLEVSAGSDFHAPHPWSELGVYRPLTDDLPHLWKRFVAA